MRCVMELQEIERCAMHNEPLPDGLGQPEQYAISLSAQAVPGLLQQTDPKGTGAAGEEAMLSGVPGGASQGATTIGDHARAVGSGESFRLCPDTDYSNSRYG